MAKDTYYFPHDMNAIHDPKCAALIRDYGLAGYGFYWMLVEVMHQQEGGKLEKFPKLYEGLAQEFGCPLEMVTKQIEALLHDYCLLQEDAKHIWSKRVLKNLDFYKKNYASKQEAGRLGGIQSGISRNYKNRTKQNEAPLQANEQKEKKLKEKKRNRGIEFIENNTAVKFGNGNTQKLGQRQSQRMKDGDFEPHFVYEGQIE